MAFGFFTGSYTMDDVRFLLKPITMQDTPIALKEALIQSGEKHYSELLTQETLPSQDYLRLFHQALVDNRQRVAADLLCLADQIVANNGADITLVSLARAGTPIGVLLKHILKRYYHTDVYHYSISILRDIGIDEVALQYLVQHHAPTSLVFVDGWTGKGSIAKQLAASLSQFFQQHNVFIPYNLHVLTDLSGSATVSATSDDYLIPSCLLNATVSGLISRTVYDKASTAADFHGCVYYQDYAQEDLSRYFIDDLLTTVANLAARPNKPNRTIDRNALQHHVRSFIQAIMQDYGVSHEHYIKPGLGEATRVLLRRKTRLLLLREADNPASQALRWLAQSKAIPIVVRSDLPYQAAALIKEV